MIDTATISEMIAVSTVVDGLPERRRAAWQSFLRAHARIAKRLDADLISAHDLTLSDYDVLIQLSWAGGRLRPSELADRILLSRGGVTRLLSGLESKGFVERSRSCADGRVFYAVLAAAGSKQLQAASKTHRQGIDELFTSHFSGRELKQLAALLGRLADGEPADKDRRDLSELRARPRFQPSSGRKPAPPRV